MNVVATPVFPHRPVRPILLKQYDKQESKYQIGSFTIQTKRVTLTGVRNFRFHWAYRN